MTYILYVDASCRWRWYLLAADQSIIANSAEGYPTRQDCLTAVGLVRGSAGTPILLSLQGGDTLRGAASLHAIH